MFTPGQSIQVSDKSAEFLGKVLVERISDLEDTYRGYFDDIRVHWSWYEATPLHKTKDFPFKNASNIVVPLIQGQTDAMVNQLFGMVFAGGDRIWAGRTENEALRKHVRDIMRFLNWAGQGNDFDFRSSIYEWISELVPIGSSVLALNWREDIRPIFVGKKGTDFRTIQYARGPIYEHAPREQWLWDTTFPISEAPEVVRELNYSWSQINHIAELNGWRKGFAESVRGDGGLDGPSQAVRRAKRTSDSAQDPPSSEPHDLREVHIDWPILRSSGFQPTKTDGEFPVPGKERSGTPSPPLVAVVHRNTGRLAHLKAEPYNLPYKPFFDGYYRKRTGRGHSVGLAKKLHPLQQAATVLLNQTIDARTRANSVWGKTTKKDLANRPLDPRSMIHVTDMASVEPFNLQTNVLQDTSIINMVNIMAERLTGQADPAFGRESRQGGHPSPATSTLALLGQKEEMIGTTRELIRVQVSKMGEAAAALYQQFETNEDGRLERILGDEDAGRVSEFLFPTDSLVGNMKFDVVGMNENTNPQAEINKIIQLRQSNVNYWAFLGQAAQALAQARGAGPALADIAALMEQSIKAQTAFEERILAAGGIDDPERFVAELRQASSQLQQAGAGPGALGPGAGAAQGAPVAQPNRLNGAGAPAGLGGPSF